MMPTWSEIQRASEYNEIETLEVNLRKVRISIWKIISELQRPD